MKTKTPSLFFSLLRFCRALAAGAASAILLCHCNTTGGGAGPAGGDPALYPGGDPASQAINVPTWSIQYEGSVVPRGKDYHIVDLFDVSDAALARLKAEGTRPIAYFSSQFEDWRPDSGQFLPEDLGLPLGRWKGERWVNTRSDAIRQIMVKRLDLAQARGFYGVDIDNVDGYLADTGFPYSRGDALQYIRFLMRESQRRGLQFGLKNALELVPDLKNEVDYFVNEEAHEQGDIGVYRGIGKPILNIEYSPLSFGTPGIYTVYKRGAVMDAREIVVPPKF